MADPTTKRSFNPKAATGPAGATGGFSASYVFMEIVNRRVAEPFSDDFQFHVGVLFALGAGALAAWATRDRDEEATAGSPWLWFALGVAVTVAAWAAWFWL